MVDFKYWAPKSFLVLRNYSWHQFAADLLAGVTVGLVALPLAMAFAIASGVPPQLGLYCAIIAGFLISALGGSSTQIGGPTGAFVVVVFGIVSKYGIEGLYLCTLMAGVFLVVMGATGLGSAVKFIPRPVVVGFTNGIAVIIASTQIKDFFGLKIEHVPGEFWGRLEALGQNFGTISYTETLLGVWALVVIIFCVRYVKKIPGYIVALFVGTFLVWALKLPVETIGTRFGGIPSGLPVLNIPPFHFSHLRPLIGPAITVGMLGAIESLMSAVVSDRMSGDKHNPNVELVAQGIANIVSPMFGGLPATGAIARTATNIRSGARTPVAGMAHALTLLAILMFAAPLAKFIPLTVLVGNFICSGLQHGRVARDSGAAETAQAGNRHVVADVSADSVRGPDGGGGSGNDHGRVGVYSEGDQHYHRFASNSGVRGVWTAAQPAGQRHSSLCCGFSDSWAVPVRGSRQNRRRNSAITGAAAGDYSALAQYDGD